MECMLHFFKNLKGIIESRLGKIFVSLIGSIALRYPFWVFQFGSAELQKTKPWSDNFKLMCVWDCGIYAKLSQEYVADNTAFFPGFPFLVRLINWILPSLSSVAATLLISNVMTIIAGMLTLWFGNQLWFNLDRDKSYFLGFQYKSWMLLIVVSIFPTGHFWLRGFSEPIFFLGLIGILWLVRCKHWRSGSIIAGMMSVLRPQGVWICAAYFSFFFIHHYLGSQSNRNSTNLLKTITVLIFACTPFGLFMCWLWHQTGDPLYFYTLQSGWGRHFSLLDGLWEHRPRFHMGVFFLYLSLFTTYQFLKRPEHHWKLLAIFTFVLADLPMYVGGYLSYPRFMSVNLGLLVILTEFAIEKPILGISLFGWSLARLAEQSYKASFGMWTS